MATPQTKSNPVSILGDASTQDLKRLLELYPVSILRDHWPNQAGTKEELCSQIAQASKDSNNLEGVIQFADEYLSCCKQHIYVFSHAADIGQMLDITLPNSELVKTTVGENRRNLLYIFRSSYNVVLRDPLEEVELNFLWPVRLDFIGGHLLIRFVILEKNMGSYFENRHYYVERRGDQEKIILDALVESTGESLSLMAMDLHRGVKKLWDDKIIDSPKVRYKKEKSTDLTEMDEDAGLRENDPELYHLISQLPLFKTLFQVKGAEGLSIDVFSVDPSEGIIHFPRYSENKGDTDYVVEQILEHNQTVPVSAAHIEPTASAGWLESSKNIH